MAFLSMTSEERRVKQLLIDLLKKKGHQKFAQLLQYFSVQIVPANSGHVAYTVFEKQAVYINEGFIRNKPPLAPNQQREIFEQLDPIIRHEICHNIFRHQVRTIKQYSPKIPELHLKTSSTLHELDNILEDFEISNLAYDAEDKQILKNLLLNNNVIQCLVTEIDAESDWANASYEQMTEYFKKIVNKDKAYTRNYFEPLNRPLDSSRPLSNVGQVLKDAGKGTEWYRSSRWEEAAEKCCVAGCSKINSTLLDLVLYCVQDIDVLDGTTEGTGKIPWQFAEIRQYFKALNNWLEKNINSAGKDILKLSLYKELSFVFTSNTMGGITLDFVEVVDDLAAEYSENMYSRYDGHKEGEIVQTLDLHNLLENTGFFDSNPAITVYTPEEKSLTCFYLAFLLQLVSANFSYTEAVVSEEAVTKLWNEIAEYFYFSPKTHPFLRVCPFNPQQRGGGGGGRNKNDSKRDDDDDDSTVEREDTEIPKPVLKKLDDSDLSDKAKQRYADLERLGQLYKNLIDKTTDEVKKQAYINKLKEINSWILR